MKKGPGFILDFIFAQKLLSRNCTGESLIRFVRLLRILQ